MRISYVWIGLVFLACSTNGERSQEMPTKGAESLADIETHGVLPGSAKAIQDICASAMKTVTSQVDEAIARPKAKRTFANTFLAMDGMMSTIDTAASAAYLLKEVHPDPELRKVATQCVLDIEKYSNELMLRKDFYEAVAAKTFSGLKGEDLKYQKDVVRGFMRSGVHLPDKKRNRVKEIRDELSQLETQFSSNIASDKRTITATEAELKGLPERAKEKLKKEGANYELGMDYPTVNAVMENVEVEETRKRMQVAFLNRAAPQNIALLEKVIALRDELSRLLGFANYAEFQLDDLMAKKPTQVRKFLSDLSKRAQQKAKKDLKELEDLKKKITGTAQVNTWDRAYLTNKLKQEKYKLDVEKVSEYFSVEQTVGGMFHIYQTLFNVEFREVPPRWKWHPDVKYYQVWSKDKNSRRIGHFYVDLFPRADKYSHAAQFGIVSGRELPDGSYQTPMAVVVANFPKPSGDTPALLKHRDVETFFHEFGHCLHTMLTQAKYRGHSGTSVARDFVEAPSQMFENWVWDKESLSFAKHYKTGEVFPAALLKSMLATKHLGTGLDIQQQIYYSDLSMHLFSKGPKVDTRAAVKDLMEQHTLFSYTPGTHFQAAFGHLMGYGAGYYGYLWSRVYAEDMFTKFDGKNILSSKVGGAYRDKILARGSGREEMKSVVDFLGRRPNTNAFFKSLGF